MTKNKQAKNCWEFHNCPEGKRNLCPVYKLDSGSECWFLSKHGDDCEKCIQCEWFKANNLNA